MSHSNYLTQNMLIKMSLSQNVSFKMSHLKSLTVNIPWISHSKCLNPNVSLGSNLTCRLNSYKAGKSCVTAQTHSSATLIQSLIVRLANLGWRLDQSPCSVISLQPAISSLKRPCRNSMMASRPRSEMLQQRRIKPWIPVAPCGKFWMKSKMSESFALSKQMVSKPRTFKELKKLAFICWSWEVLTVLLGEVSAPVTSLSLLLTSLMLLLLVMDWLEAEEVAVEVQLEAEDQLRIARQCKTGLTSFQNSGWYSTSLHFWQTCARTARSFWLGNRQKKSWRNGLSCQSSSQVMNLKEIEEISFPVTNQNLIWR